MYNVLSILFYVYIQVEVEAKSTHVTVVGPILNQLDEKTLQVSFKIMKQIKIICSLLGSIYH